MPLEPTGAPPGRARETVPHRPPSTWGAVPPAHCPARPGGRLLMPVICEPVSAVWTALCPQFTRSDPHQVQPIPNTCAMPDTPRVLHTSCRSHFEFVFAD